jgi:hypothetical protein
MKVHIWTASLTLATLCALGTSANAQYGGGTNGVNPNRMPDYTTNPRLTDTMIRNRMERRRMEERLRRNRSGKSGRHATTGKKTGARKPGASFKPVSAPLPPYGIEIRRDSFQNSHRENGNGFKTNFSFTSVATGKTISKSGVCPLYDVDSAIEGIPAGTYIVRAEVFDGGKKYAAHLGSKEGTTENPQGGDFAPTLKIVLKPMVDSGGSRVMGITPAKIYVRVLG